MKVITTIGFLIVLGGFLFFFQESFFTRRAESKKAFTLLEKGKTIESLKYDFFMERPERITEGTFWQKGEKVRMSAVVEGKKTVYLAKEKNDIVYVYDPEENFVVKIDFSEADKVQRVSLKEYIKRALDSKLVVIGEEVLGGKECLIVEYNSEKGKEKVWLWKDYGVPIKTEIEELSMITKVENIEIIDLPDSLFELPKDIGVIDLSF